MDDILEKSCPRCCRLSGDDDDTAARTCNPKFGWRNDGRRGDNDDGGDDDDDKNAAVEIEIECLMLLLLLLLLLQRQLR